MEYMKAGDLRKYLNRLHEYDEKHDDLILAVVTNDSSLGARSHVYVKSATVGFDWEHGRLMITVDKPITLKQKKEETNDTR